MRILLAWERGRGGGYARRLAALAAGLAAAGHEPVLALRDPAQAAGLPEAAGVALRAAPFHESPLRTPGDFVPDNLADLLASGGFDDRDALLRLVRRWMALLDELRPALAVAEFAPALCLAARGRCPVVQLGTGFTLPPAEGPWFPSYQVPRPPYVAQADILAIVDDVLGELGRPPLPGLAALHADTLQLIHGLPQLDPFHGRRPASPCVRAIGPFLPLPAPEPPPATVLPFAYVDLAAPYAPALLEAMAGLPWPAEAFVPRADEALLARFAGSGLLIHKAAPPLHGMLARASHVVHAGGLETAMAATALGRPQLLLPRNLPQYLIARVLIGSRIAVGSGPDRGTAGLRAAIEAFVGDPARLAEAARAAAFVQGQGPFDGVGRAVAICRRLLAGRDPA
ncbi:MAG TPA: hypothetical protein PKA13_19210 [Geminicoccaceae bacterium]|nr:hypothetical protein [Geminicoccus sp.]HMU51913.1 hypothetical protein [Geminicoccaceae bacterium]